MPTVVREGAKSRQKGLKTGDFGTGLNTSPEPGLGKSTLHDRGVKDHEVDAKQKGLLENEATTLSKPEENVDYLSQTSGGSGLAIVPLGNEHIITPERVLREDDETRLQPRDHKEIYEQEQKDIVPALPEGWPGFKNRAWRRRSCDLVKSTSSCVRKAVSHLHHLQNLLDSTYIYYKSSPTEKDSRNELGQGKSSASGDGTLSLSRTCSPVKDGSYQKEPPTSYSGSDHRLRWLLSSASIGEFDKEQEVALDKRLESSASGAILEVRGTSAGTLQIQSLTPKPPPTESDEQLSGPGIIDEVLTLLGRLETDRVNTGQNLQKEKKRVHQLGMGIDKFAYRRMQELPFSVQREHEACAIDINELRWHCAYNGRIETRLKEKLKQAESKHGKLLQDLENMQKHCPLVEEKLDLEGEAMSSIQSKQDETDDELRSTLERLQSTEMKTASAQGKASQERTLIKQDVDVVRNELNAVSDELAQLKMYYTSNTHTMHDIRNTLEENAEMLVQLEHRKERIIVLEANQQDKVKRLREKIVEQEAEHHKLVEENNALRTEKEIMKAVLQTEVSKLEYRMNNASSRVREVAKRNRDNNTEIVNIKKKIDISAKQRVADEKTIIRAQLEIEKVREQLCVSKEETDKIGALHSNLTETMIIQREETMSVEESLKTTADALRKQLKDEAHARTVLQARIAADGADLVKTTVDSKKKREKATVRADEIEHLVNHVKEQVAKLEKIHNERQLTISELDKILGKVVVQHNDMETKLTYEHTQLIPSEVELKKENMDLTKKIDHMTWKSEMMEKKMQDMESSSSMMNKAMTTTTETIKDLTEEMTELSIQLETGHETEQHLESSLALAEERTKRGEDDHNEHMAQRRIVFETNQRGVQTSLEENKRLARRYQYLQRDFLNNKAAFLRDFERRVYNEDSLKDHRQLSVLQERMHEALEHYYKLRGLQSRAGIACCELKSAENGGKLIWLQTEMMRVIENVTRFLEANNAAHDVISLEAAKIATTPPGQTLVS